MVEYDAKIKTGKRVLTITDEEGEKENLRLVLKPDTDEWKIENLAERIAEISETPVSLKLATESDIEVKAKGRKRKK